MKPLAKNFRIKEVWAFIAIDPVDNSEGVIGMSSPSGWIPFIGADEERVRELYPFANRIAREKGIAIKLIKLSQRQDIKTLNIE